MYAKEIEEHLKKPTWTKAHVTYVMLQFRLFLEENNLKETYKFLNLYCNWTLHTEISGSKTAYRILELLTDSLIASNADPKNAKHISDAIIEGLSLHKLLEDIINIGNVYNIPSAKKFSDLKVWKIFGTTLIEILSQRPLKFPDPINSSAKPIYDSIMAKAEKTPVRDHNAIIGVQFVYVENSKGLCWQIMNPDTIARNITIMGQMAFINQAVIDKYAKKV